MAAHGRTAGVVAIRRDVHVGPDARSAAAVAEPVIAGGYRGFRPEAFVWGGVEQVAERVDGIHAAHRPRHDERTPNPAQRRETGNSASSSDDHAAYEL